MACTGAAREKSRSPNQSSSIIDSTRAVTPTFRKVATSARLASPQMTCRRRYFMASAWGSSRVLTIGPLQRGLEADLLLEEVGPLGELERHVDAAGRRRLATRPCRRRCRSGG